MQVLAGEAHAISIHAPVKGATVVPLHRLLPRQNFNPRSREGSDDRIIHGHCLNPISIHAPVKGATDQEICLMEFNEISIHAPVKGATGG